MAQPYLVGDLDPRIGHNFVDANALDRRGGPEGTAISEILRLYEHENSAFRLLVSSSVRDEIKHPKTPIEVKRKALLFMFSEDVELTEEEIARRDSVRALIQGNSKPGQHQQDADHLFWSAKYHGRHFITNDKRLLKMTIAVWMMLKLKVLKPSEFLASLRIYNDGIDYCSKNQSNSDMMM